MTSVRIGYMTFTNLQEIGDRDSFEAKRLAEQLRSTGFKPRSARVERNDGLVLLSGTMDPTTPGHRFRHAVCGFNGTGPIITAEILELFGFGAKADLLDRLSQHPELVF